MVHNAHSFRMISIKYTINAKEQIKKIRKDLEKEYSYFIGSTVVKANITRSFENQRFSHTLIRYEWAFRTSYEKQTGETVSLSFVDRVLKEAGLTKTNRTKEKILNRISLQLKLNLMMD